VTAVSRNRGTSFSFDRCGRREFLDQQRQRSRSSEPERIPDLADSFVRRYQCPCHIGLSWRIAGPVQCYSPRSKMTRPVDPSLQSYRLALHIDPGSRRTPYSPSWRLEPQIGLAQESLRIVSLAPGGSLSLRTQLWQPLCFDPTPEWPILPVEAYVWKSPTEIVL